MSQKNLLKITVCLLLAACCVSIAWAEIKLPAVIGDNMVLQRGVPVYVWGWATPGEEVTVAIAPPMLFCSAGSRWVTPGEEATVAPVSQIVTATAGEDGRWQATLKKLTCGEPLQMNISGKADEIITLKNILVGEVWVCSGQSNMFWPLTKANNPKAEIAAAKYPDIRLFHVKLTAAQEPQKDCVGSWLECTPATAADFSAVAYFFGRYLHKELGVPVGLINTSWGGSAAEAWTGRNALEAEPSLRPLLEHWEKIIANGAKHPVNCRPANLYNGMIAPIIPYAVRGAVWYQGESNVGRAHQYRTIFPLMIGNWRADWGQGDFPFGFVQLAPFRYGGTHPAACPELWEAQLMTLKNTPNTGMAVTVDIGNPKNVHPTNKQDVGKRLGLWAMAKVYGKKDLVYSGPIYKSMTVEGDKIRLTFDHVGSGLSTRDGKPLSYFTIAGADRRFHPAVATIDGRTIVVHSDAVKAPVAVRYAWHDTAEPNLCNNESLPASPFRTDSFKGVTE